MERIGFIGLGVMGKPMARNLLRAGFQVVVHNRSRGGVDELVAEGATEAGAPAEVGKGCDVAITMLPDSPDVEMVVLGTDGLAAGLRPGSLFIDMSTVAPATARSVHEALADREVAALDAPVSGGETGAIEGTLSIMVGGAEVDVSRAGPIFEVLGSRIVHVGPAGAGQVTKACNQIVVALTIGAVAEALILAERSGVDAGKVVEALLGGFAQSRVLEVHGRRMLDRAHDPGFRLRLHRKDLAIALQTGRESGVPLFATAQAAVLMDALVATGRGELDHSALALLYRDLSGP